MEWKGLIDKEMGKESSDVYSDLKGAITIGQEIIDVQLVNQEEKLNGNMEKIEYKFYFKNGDTKNIEFIYIKPTISGGMKLMDVKSNE